MPTNQEFSSKQILEAIPQFEGIDFDADTLNDFYKEVDKEMKDFEMKKNQRIASSTEDLSKLIITA